MNLRSDVRIFAVPIMYHLPDNVIPAAVGLVAINLQPKYELSSLTVYGQF